MKSIAVKNKMTGKSESITVNGFEELDFRLSNYFKRVTMTTLNLQPFKNPQTGNTAQMLIDGDGLCDYYQEICTTGVVNAGRDHEELHWASWTPDDEVCPSHYVAGEACLDDALSGLESQLEALGGNCPWHSETTGL